MTKTHQNSARLEIVCPFLAWGVILLWLLISGRYLLFLRPGFWPLLVLSLCILSAFLTAAISDDRIRFAGSYAALWIRVGVLVLPIFYLLVAQHKPLGSHAFTNRSIPSTLARALTQNKAPAKDPKNGVVTLLEILQNFDQYRGKRVVTEGMVYRDEVVPAGHFLVFRFLIVCCAADALPAGALVKYDRARALEFDSWVRVEGILDLKTVNGLLFPYIKADKVSPINTPKLPYLYPGLLQ